MQRLLIFLILLPAISFAAIYKWTDKQGNVHYSDRPQRGAKKIVLPPAPTYQPPVKPTENKTEYKTMPMMGDELGMREYKVVAISQPENSATVRNNQGYVAVSVDLMPALVNGDKVVITLDGKVVGQPQTSANFSLSGVNRGTHTLAVKIIDESGSTVAESESIVFHMHRPRVGMVPPSSTKGK